MKSNFCSRELQEEKKNVTTILEAIKNNSNQRNTLKCPFPLERAIKYFGGKQEKNKQWDCHFLYEIKLVQFFMKVNAYNLKYSRANSEEHGSAKSTH